MSAEDSLQSLKSDLKRNSELAAMAALPVDVRTDFKETMWAVLDGLLEPQEEFQNETNDALAELIEQTEDFLHEETAKEIGKPIGIGLALAEALEKVASADPKVMQLIKEYRASAQTALATLREITAPDEIEGEEGEGEDGNE